MARQKMPEAKFPIRGFMVWFGQYGWGDVVFKDREMAEHLGKCHSPAEIYEVVIRPRDRQEKSK